MALETMLSTLCAQLNEERAQLRRQLVEMGVDGSNGMSFDENFADSGQVAAEQGEAMMLASSLREQLGDVEHALQKFDGDSYGACEVCGRAIAEPRIEAMPATRYCIQHA